eukprot:c20203_g1_i1 orf=121-1011(+)
MSSGAFCGSLRNAFSYCVQQVHAYDYEHYLCALHLPVGLRSASFVLRSFNVETARAVEHAREVNLAIMRLTWWREAVNGIYNKSKAVEHPVVLALNEVVHKHRLSKHWFLRLVDARLSDLEAVGGPKTLGDVEKYAENTSSALLYLTLEAAGVRTTAADHAAAHVGKAEGIAILLRATPHHSQRRHTYIPIELTAKCGVSQEEIYRGMHCEGLADAVLEMASAARAHLEKARSLASTVPQAAFPVLLAAVPTGLLLDSIQRVQFNVFDPRLARGVCGVSPIWMQLQLKWHAFRSTY